MNPIIYGLRAMLVCVLCWATASDAEAVQPRATTIQPIFAEGQVAPGLQGIWHAPGRGWLLDIDAQGVRRWQLTRAGCYRSQAQAGWPMMGQLEFAYAAVTDAGRRAAFEYFPGDQPSQFTRLRQLPELCGAFDLSGERATFEAFAAIMDQHYAFFAQRGIDWRQRVRQARPLARDGMGEAALKDLLAGLLDGLGDSHTKLIGSVAGEAFKIQDGQGQTLPMIRAGIGESAWLVGLLEQLRTLLDDGGLHVARERILWGVIDGRVGYLQVFTMGGFSDQPIDPLADWAAAELAAFDRVMDQALTRFAKLDGVIVDLSNNRGGYDGVARALAARFSDRPFDAYRMDTDADGLIDLHYRIQPAAGPRFTGPVLLLTSDVTVSGGEIATLALRALEHVTHIGQTTRGSFSTPLAKPLPNGWYLELSSEVISDAKGQVHEGSGIVPTESMTVFSADDPIASHAQLIARIARRLSAQRAQQ